MRTGIQDSLALLEAVAQDYEHGGTLVPVRDSKIPLGPKLVFRAEAWAAFVEELKGS